MSAISLNSLLPLMARCRGPRHEYSGCCIRGKSSGGYPFVPGPGFPPSSLSRRHLLTGLSRPFGFPGASNPSTRRSIRGTILAHCRPNPGSRSVLPLVRRFPPSHPPILPTRYSPLGQFTARSGDPARLEGGLRLLGATVSDITFAIWRALKSLLGSPPPSTSDALGFLSFLP